MALSVTKADVWAAEIPDQAGALAAKVEGLAKANVDLDFLIARRQPDKPGTGIAFVSGVKGARGIKAAQDAGFAKTAALSALRVEGPNKPGSCHAVLRQAADGGINLRGVSALKVGSKFVAVVAVDTVEDADKLAKLLKTTKRR